MNKKDYNAVLNTMRLDNGKLWPIPITLDIDQDTIDLYKLKKGIKISLRYKEGFLIAILLIEDIWHIDKIKEAKAIYGTDDVTHPGVNYLFNKVPAFRLVLITKRIDNQNKVNILKNALKMFNPLIVEFLSIIVINNQTNNLLNIISRFNRLVNLQSDIKEIDIITANKLDEQEIQALSQTICNKLNSNPKINTLNDPDLIGGIKLRIGNKIFDNSISYQINQLKKNLHNM